MKEQPRANYSIFGDKAGLIREARVNVGVADHKPAMRDSVACPTRPKRPAGSHIDTMSGCRQLGSQLTKMPSATPGGS